MFFNKNNLMRKFIPLLVLLLIFSLSACNKNTLDETTMPTHTNDKNELIGSLPSDDTKPTAPSINEDENHDNETEPSQPEAEHTHSYIEEMIMPTCTKDGVLRYTCSECGICDREEAIPAMGHNYGDWVIVQESTTETTGTAERTCNICGEAEVKTLDILTP